MNEIARLNKVSSLLSPEQLKAMEEVFQKWEMTIESFKLMKKDYANVKNNVKRVEKKLMAILEEEGPEVYVAKWIEREIASIENKYKDIDYAIKRYDEAMKGFHTMVSSPHFRTFNPLETRNYYVVTPRSYLSNASLRIDAALNAIRITKRYFKNIASAFKSHAQQKEFRKQREHRQWLQQMNEIKAAEQTPVQPEQPPQPPQQETL